MADRTSRLCAGQRGAIRAARSPAPRPRRSRAAGGGAARGQYHDSFILKFTEDGKFLGEIGNANGSRGSLDTKNVRGVATIRFISGTNELVAADGYGDHRVSVWDADHPANSSGCGSIRQAPDRRSQDYALRSNSPQLGNPVHCAQPSNDGLIYVCDRTNDRFQVFKTDGTFVKQYPLEVNTRGDGAPWEIAFSNDPQQKFLVRLTARTR